jgi:arylsulfatase A-like enzyme
MPAYATLFTGLLPHEHGAVGWNNKLTENILVERLNNYGYKTYSVSPHYVLGDNGAAPAFDVAETIQVGHRDLLFDDDPVFEKAKQISRGKGWESNRDLVLDLVGEMVSERCIKTPPNALYYLYQEIRQRLGFWGDNGAKKVLERADKIVSNASDPFFLFMNFVEPHEPYLPPQGYARRFASNASIADVNNVAAIDLGSVVAGERDITPSESDLLRDLYDAEIAYLNELLGTYLGPHVKNGLLEDTVVVFLSDHGDLFGEWGLWGHQGRIHNNLARVPLIVSHPDSDPGRNGRVLGLSEVTEYLCGVGAGSVASEDPVPDPSGEAFVEYYGWDSQKLNPPWVTYDSVERSDWDQYQASCITSGHKLLWDSDGRVFLSDRTADPDETTDLSGERPDIVASLKKRIRDEIGEPSCCYSEFRSARAENDLKAETAARLEHLGYK